MSGTCACGLRSKCPLNRTDLSCPIWRRHVRPNWYERIVGTIAAFFGWRF